VTFQTAYQAVLLTNGSVYYGKLEGLSGPFPMLRDVFYVQAAADPSTNRLLDQANVGQGGAARSETGAGLDEVRAAIQNQLGGPDFLGLRRISSAVTPCIL
jgi:hypothetical protein